MTAAFVHARSFAAVTLPFYTDRSVSTRTSSKQRTFGAVNWMGLRETVEVSLKDQLRLEEAADLHRRRSLVSHHYVVLWVRRPGTRPVIA